MSGTFFSLVSLLRLAGQQSAAEVLIDAAIPLAFASELDLWARGELVEWAMYATYEGCVPAGLTSWQPGSICCTSISAAGLPARGVFQAPQQTNCGCCWRERSTGALDRVSAPATVLAIHLLYNFLGESSLVDKQTRANSQRICLDLWQDLQRWMGDRWWKYRFLEEYWLQEP